MPEEWGTLVIKPSEKDPSISSDAKGKNIDAVLERALSYTGLNSDILDDIAPIDSGGSGSLIKSSLGYIVIEYDCGELIGYCKTLVKHGKNIEFYARTGDEYGTLNFFALDEKQQRFHLCFDEGGDEFQFEESVESVKKDLDTWLSLIPKKLKETIPDFMDIDPDALIY